MFKLDLALNQTILNSELDSFIISQTFTISNYIFPSENDSKRRTLLSKFHSIQWIL